MYGRHQIRPDGGVMLVEPVLDLGDPPALRAKSLNLFPHEFVPGDESRYHLVSPPPIRWIQDRVPRTIPITGWRQHFLKILYFSVDRTMDLRRERFQFVP